MPNKILYTIFQKSKIITIVVLLFLVPCNLLSAETSSYSIPERPYLCPKFGLSLGLSYGAQPIVPAPKIRIIGSYLFLELGYEVSLGTFVAGWESHTWFFGIDSGPFEIGYKFASSSIGISNDSMSSYNSEIVFIAIKGYDNQFLSYSIVPAVIEFGYAVKFDNRSGSLKLPDDYLSMYLFGLPITLDLRILDIPFFWNPLQLKEVQLGL